MRSARGGDANLRHSDACGDRGTPTAPWKNLFCPAPDASPAPRRHRGNRPAFGGEERRPERAPATAADVSGRGGEKESFLETPPKKSTRGSLFSV